MMHIEESSIEAAIKSAVREMLTGADHLRGLAQALDGFAGLNARAELDEIKHVAIGVRATAVQTLLTATSAVGLSERLATVASIIEFAQPDDESDG